MVRSAEKNLRLDGSTNSGHIRSSFGGVGRNIADVLACLGADPVGERQTVIGHLWVDLIVLTFRCFYRLLEMMPWVNRF